MLHHHVVICGLGRKSFVIARECLRRGESVVVINGPAVNWRREKISRAP